MNVALRPASVRCNLVRPGLLDHRPNRSLVVRRSNQPTPVFELVTNRELICLTTSRGSTIQSAGIRSIMKNELNQLREALI